MQISMNYNTICRLFLNTIIFWSISWSGFEEDTSLAAIVESTSSADIASKGSLVEEIQGF
jgi:hypothetical protein